MVLVQLAEDWKMEGVRTILNGLVTVMAACGVVWVAYPSLKYEYIMEGGELLSIAGMAVVWAILIYAIGQIDANPRSVPDFRKALVYLSIVAGVLGCSLLILYPEWQYVSDGLRYSSEPTLEIRRIAVWDVHDYKNAVWHPRNLMWFGGVLLVSSTLLCVYWLTKPPSRLEKEPDPDWL